MAQDLKPTARDRAMSDLSEFEWQVRTEVYRFFIETTNAPTVADIAEALDAAASDIETSLRRLEENHHIALSPGTSNIWMANPFSAIPTEFPAETSTGRYWANCAWDAVGIPATLGRDSWTRTRCAETGIPIQFGVRDGAFVAGEQVIHIAVPVRAFYDNIGFT